MRSSAPLAASLLVSLTLLCCEKIEDADEPGREGTGIGRLAALHHVQPRPQLDRKHTVYGKLVKDTTAVKELEAAGTPGKEPRPLRC